MPPFSVPEEGPLAPLPVANLRFLSFVGSMREDQSEFEGGMSIHSSRFWGMGVGSLEADVGEVVSWVWFWVPPFVGGREGPKSSSEEEEGEFGVGFWGEGGEEGRSDRGAGGGAGPIVRRRLLEVVLDVEELRD